MNPLPPDPYLALGVSKAAQIAEIRSAHRKLVLKCHPDKVQDEALKAIKQDEFQKVQQAYELLSDETKRAQYDQHVKLLELRKEMGRGGPGPLPAGANVYYAEPRTASAAYRTKPTPQAYASRYDSDEQKYSTPRRSSSYDTKSKSASKDEARRRRKEEEAILEARREADFREADLRARESKREKEAHADRKKSRDKERKKASVEKTSSRYIEEESDSEELRGPPRRMKFRDVVDMATKASREETRRAEKLVDGGDHRREKTRAAMESAIRYVRASTRGASEPHKTTKPVFVPDSPPIPTINEEDSIRRSSARSARRPSGDNASSSRRTKDSSRSRESPRLSSKDKKRSDPRMVDEIPIRKPALFTQSSAPPEIPSTRERPHRSNTTDPKYSARGPHGPPLSRASTFNGNEKGQPRSSSHHKHQPTYESASSSSDSESDTPVYKQASPTRQRPPMMPKVSSYKIVRDINGQRLGERIHDLNDVYEEPRERSPSPRRPTENYQRTASSRPSNSRAPPSQPFYAAQPIPAVEREPARVHTVGPGAREARPQYKAATPAIYGSKIKVAYAAPISREDISFSPQQDLPRRDSDPESRFANYPSINPTYKREEPSYRKATYAS